MSNPPAPHVRDAVKPDAPAPQFVQLHHEDRDAVRAEIADGLLRPAARIAPKYFYDALGSRLFDAITELPEYYPTRTEASIFAEHGGAIADALGRVETFVDLGAGSCAKADALLPRLAPHRYVAVDISVDYLREALVRMARRHPSVAMVGVGMDFSRALALPPEAGDGPRTMFYPGSSIGNFLPHEAVAFLRQVKAAARGGSLLIGVDLAKPAPILQDAYDDPLGVTGAFNLNVLRHLNALMGTDFDVRDWRHVVRIDEARGGCVEMHLQARRALQVRWPDRVRGFADGERIHTEDSHKYTVDGFASLLREAGWTRQTCWTDARGWFAVFVAEG